MQIPFIREASITLRRNSNQVEHSCLHVHKFEPLLEKYDFTVVENIIPKAELKNGQATQCKGRRYLLCLGEKELYRHYLIS